MTSSVISRLARPRLNQVLAAWPAIGAALLGLALLYLAGFAGPHSVHEAAHDARHGMNFPCH